ncbi:hypothetical protein L218DRAFT_505123 [Marasmius fiardii PR-910]|nr:hypothetical protein L218DRAFT_505123 [Marasmius fiardii PR-910]
MEYKQELHPSSSFLAQKPPAFFCHREMGSLSINFILAFLFLRFTACVHAESLSNGTDPKFWAPLQPAGVVTASDDFFAEPVVLQRRFTSLSDLGLGLQNISARQTCPVPCGGGCCNSGNTCCKTGCCPGGDKCAVNSNGVEVGCCARSDVQCANGRCCTSGWQCCDNNGGGCCWPGTHCCGDRQCCDGGSGGGGGGGGGGTSCGNGKTCPSGQNCCGSGCSDQGSQCCQDHQCNNGSQCCGSGCFDPNSEICCDGKGTCPKGDTCCGDVCCRPGSTCQNGTCQAGSGGGGGGGGGGNPPPPPPDSSTTTRTTSSTTTRTTTSIVIGTTRPTTTPGRFTTPALGTLGEDGTSSTPRSTNTLSNGPAIASGSNTGVSISSPLVPLILISSVLLSTTVGGIF